MIYTEMINSCFSTSIALPYKINVIMFTILLGSVALDSNLRNSASTIALFLAVYLPLNVILFLAVAYSIPGMVNTVSKQVQKGWLTVVAKNANIFSCSKKRLRELRQDFKAIRDIRIRFGELNYYERDTGANILKFIMDSMVNLALMI